MSAAPRKMMRAGIANVLISLAVLGILALKRHLASDINSSAAIAGPGSAKPAGTAEGSPQNAALQVASTPTKPSPLSVKIPPDNKAGAPALSAKGPDRGVRGVLENRILNFRQFVPLSDAQVESFFQILQSHLELKAALDRDSVNEVTVTPEGLCISIASYSEIGRQLREKFEQSLTKEFTPQLADAIDDLLGNELDRIFAGYGDATQKIMITRNASFPDNFVISFDVKRASTPPEEIYKYNPALGWQHSAQMTLDELANSTQYAFLLPTLRERSSSVPLVSFLP